MGLFHMLKIKSTPGTILINLIYLVLCTGFMAIMSSFIIAGVILIFSNFDYGQLGLLTGPENYPNRKWLFLLAQGLSNLLIFCLPPLFILYVIQKQRLQVWFLKNQRMSSIFILSILLLLFCMPLLGIFTEWNQAIPLPENWAIYFQELNIRVEKIYNYITTIEGTSDFLLTFFFIAVIPAVSEELMFRGILQTNLMKVFNIHLAILITAFIFGILHLQFYLVLPRVFLGVLFGYIFFYTSNLLFPIVMHFIYNGLVLTFIYFFDLDISEQLVEKNILDHIIPYVSIVLLIIGLKILKKHVRHNRAILKIEK